jgi:alpha-1,3/alpha-1,6-mannosyltransferase
VASALLYTPAREHFGIVPIEAMSMGTPVVAVASAGPLETISDGHTGFLCAQTPVDFSNNMMRFIIDPQLSLNMARTCRSHVEQHFTPDILKIKLERLLVRCADNEDSRVRTSYFLRKCLFGVARCADCIRSNDV